MFLFHGQFGFGSRLENKQTKWIGMEWMVGSRQSPKEILAS